VALAAEKRASLPTGAGIRDEDDEAYVGGGWLYLYSSSGAVNGDGSLSACIDRCRLSSTASA
jgi:hypothetical protein